MGGTSHLDVEDAQFLSSDLRTRLNSDHWGNPRPQQSASSEVGEFLVFSPDDERDAPYSYSTTPMRSSNMPVTDAPSPARARAAPRPRRRANRVVPSVGRWRCRARRTARVLLHFGGLARHTPRHIGAEHSPLNVFERPALIEPAPGHART